MPITPHHGTKMLFAKEVLLAKGNAHHHTTRPEPPQPKSEQGISEVPRPPVRHGPDDDHGLVPPGFTMPSGLECVWWGLKATPLKLDRGVTVFNAEDFVKRHLELLTAKLRGDEGWVYEQWSLDTLLTDLKDVGVELRIPGVEISVARTTVRR